MAILYLGLEESAMPEKKFHPNVLIILILYPLLGMGIDLITPSLPSISKNLHISHGYSKNLVTIFLMSYAVGNLVCGFLSDAMGRKKLLLGGLLLFALASLLPTICPTYFFLFLTRLLQGVAMGAFGSVARAVISDIVSEDELKRTFAWLATMWGIGPIIGPIIGGYLQYYFGWQSCFYFFSLFSGAGFLWMFFTLTETLTEIKPLNIKLIQNNFKTLIKDTKFMGLITLMGAAYSVSVVFSTLAPFVIQVELKRTVVYFGQCALWMGCMFLLGTIVCRYLVQKYAAPHIISVGVFCGVIIALMAVLAAHFYSINIALVVIPSALFFFLMGIIYPTAMGMGISLFRNLAGSASAVMNFINVVIVALVSFGMSFVDKGSDAILWTYGFLTLIMMFFYIICIKNQKNDILLTK